MNANERQVAGSHYAGEYQHWDFVVDLNLNYFEAQISRYISRAPRKNGFEDLSKALHYIQKYREVLQSSGWVSRLVRWFRTTGFTALVQQNDSKFWQFCEANNVSEKGRIVLAFVLSGELSLAENYLRDMFSDS